MQWRNRETPTFSGSAGTATGPAVVEAMELVDREGNILRAFSKDADGELSETARYVTPGVSRVVRGTIATALAGEPALLTFGNLSITTVASGAGIPDDDDGTELIAYLEANKHLIPATTITDETNGVFTVTFYPGVNTQTVASADANLTFAEVTTGEDEATELLTVAQDNGPVIAGLGNESYVTITELTKGTVRITKVVAAGLPLTVANVTGASFGFEPLVRFPAGKIHFLSSNVEDFSWGLGHVGNATPIAGTMGGDISLGSTGTTDSTLNSTDANVLASTSYDPFSTPISANSGINAILDGTATPVTVYLNAVVDDGDVANAASDVLEANGTFYFVWYRLPG